mgnify:CR=1 FL=1
MDIWSNAKVSPKWKLNLADVQKLGMNFVVFTAPMAAAFFQLMANGVPFSKAWPIALVLTYQALADVFKKLKDGSK